MKALTLTLQLAALAAIAAPSFAGGVFLSLGNPKAVSDPAAKDAIATVRVLNDVGAIMQNVRITGTAEGLVDGHRVTMQLKIEALSVPGLEGIWWEKPKDGVWVLNINACPTERCPGYAFTFDVIPVRSDGVRPQVKPYSPYPTEIDTALLRRASDAH